MEKKNTKKRGGANDRERESAFPTDLAAMMLSCRQTAFLSGTFSYDRENTRV